MSPPQVSVVSLDDGQLIELINRAESNLLFVSPGVSRLVAEALAKKWLEIEPGAVSILLDIDPEVCRLGYGAIEGIELLQRTAEQLGRTVYHRPGIRVGLLVSDRATLIFSPIPLLIEAESTPLPRPNALLLDATAPDASPTLTSFRREAEDLIQGGEAVDAGQIEEVRKDLEANPPLKFDLARVVRVFNAQFQFVEFELSGLLISRMRAPIPSDLMGLAKDQETQRLLHSTFKLVRDDSKVSGEKIFKLKKTIAEKYLVALKGYGVVCLRVNKEAFLKEVDDLRNQIKQFRNEIENQLQAEMDANRARLVKALLPAVCSSPPERWTKFIGPKPSKSAVKDHLLNELNKCFGTAKGLIKEMKANVIFKDVTYESLSDANFIEIAREAIPSLKALHEEYAAAKAREVQGTKP
jgi:hypothetical protein